MNLYLDILSNIIINTYFFDSRCLIIFSDDQNTFEYTASIPIVKIKLRQSSVEPEIFLNYFGCQGILIKSSNALTVFKEFEKEIRLNSDRFNKRKFLFLPAINMTENLMDLFKLEELKYVADLIVIEPKASNHTNYSTKLNQEVYNLWTNTYVGLKDNSKRELLDVWFSENYSFKFSRNLFPDKLSNQMGRVLKMATFQYEPYTIIGSSNEDFKGSEMSSMISFAKHYNMTPEFVINPEDYWGIIYDNWTGNGLLGNLAADKADIGFAALYTWEAEYHFLDLSQPLIRTGITCLTPAPKLAAGWLTPMHSFSKTMWFLVASTFVTSILVHFAIFYIKTYFFYSRNYSKKEPSFKLLINSFFTIFKLFLVQLIKSTDSPPGISGALFIGVLFMFSLFLSSSYSSGLATVMTIPTYEKAIDTVDEVIKNDLYWVGTHTGWTDSIVQSNDPKYKSLVKHFIPISSEETIREHSKKLKYGFALERLPHDNYAIGAYIKGDVIENYILMSEDFYWEEAVVMTRKNSILLPKLNKFISHIFEAGLINYWQNEATLFYMDSIVQKGIHTFTVKNRNYVVKLKWTHVAGAFTILGIGYVISAFIFMIEIIVYRVSNRNHFCRT